jgi:hypothetical protein
MIATIIGSFFEFLKRPFILVPALIGGLSNFILMVLSFDFLQQILYENLVLELLPITGIVNLPFYLFQLYPINFLVIGASFFVSALVNFWLVFVFAGIIAENKNPFSAMVFGLGNAGQIILLALFYSTLLFFSFFAGLFLLWIVLIAPFFPFTLVLLFGFVLFMAYFVFKLYFLPFVMAGKKLKLKQGIKECWLWSSKRLIPIAFFVVLVVLISQLFGGIGFIVSEILEAVLAVELLSFFIYYLFALAGSVFSLVALTKYYSERKDEK